MKDEKGGASIKDIAGSKPKVYSFLIDRSSKHKQAKGGNKNVIATINDNEYKDVSLNKKCLRHSTNRIKSKDYRIVQKDRMKSTKFLYHALMIKYTTKIMDMMN